MIPPASEPLRQRREAGQIVQAALQLYTQNFPVFFLIAALVVPLGIASGIFQTIDNEVAKSLIVGGISLVQIVVDVLAASAIIVALDDIDSARTPEFGHSYDLAFSKFGAISLALLRVAFHVVLLFITIIGIPWAIQRVVRWAFVQQTIMLEDATPKESLSRSADIVLGSWWRTLGIWLFISLFSAVPVAIAQLAFLLAPVAVSSTASAILSALALPFVVIATTMLYFDLKLRKEGAAALPQPPVQPEEEIV
jgi:hypothetical protein